MPALIVGGDTGLERGQQASVDLALTFYTEPLPIEVIDVLPAFPGVEVQRATIVVPVQLLDSLIIDDPRYRPVPSPSDVGLGAELAREDAGFPVQLWSDSAASLDRVITGAGIVADGTGSLAKAEQQPQLAAARRGLGYQRALGLCLSALAILALCLYADRSAARGRAADLLLRRVGLGRYGPERARAGELVLTVVLAVLLAGVGLGLLTPLAGRLVDGSSGALPALTFRLTPGATLAVLIAAAVAAVLATGVLAARARTGGDGEVLRDAE